MNLTVRQFDQKIGTLSGTADRGIIFRYDRDYLSQPTSQAISHSLPLKDSDFSTRECLPFFTGLLPDGDLKRRISDYLHVSESSTLKLLEALGGECAGTISVTNEDDATSIPQNNPNQRMEDRYRKLEMGDITKMIDRMAERPLLTGDRELRLSLAGAQQKISLARFSGKWYLPLHGAPSTHILKPSREPGASSNLTPDLAVNEFLCMQAAKEAGLPVPSTELTHFDGIPVYIIERYDRGLSGAIDAGGNEPKIMRIHQEDACQANSIMPDRKYQNDGGPGFSELVTLINECSKAPILDIRILLQAAVFNYLIGNCDAHGKNFSILYNQMNLKTRNTRLAPLYDLVSTTAYEGLSTNLSMSIGGEYRIERIRLEHFLRLGEVAGVSGKYLKGLVETMKVQTSEAIEKIGSRAELKDYSGLTNRITGQMRERIHSLSST